jgi:hypothetical protein
MAVARNLKQTRVIQESETSDSKPLRREQAKPTGLYLLELRSRTPQSPFPKRKLLVTVDTEPGGEGQPKVVKITHL